MTRDRFLGMVNQQRLANGDRSHCQVALLDSIRGSLTYPGYERDIQHAERLHIRFPSLFNDQIPFIMRKQRVFDYGNEKVNFKTGIEERSNTHESKRRKQAYPVLCSKSSESTESNCSSLAKDMVCSICLQAERDYAFIPCGHLCVCRDCAVCVACTDSRCPICRRDSTHVMKIFT